MSSENNVTQPAVTTGIPKSSGMPFVTHFIPGLVIGLLVGALAAAFVMPLLDRDNVKLPEGVPATSGGKAQPLPAPRDTEQGQPAPSDSTPAPEAKPETKPETKPEVKPETKPGDKPADAPKPTP
ncbi:hypothetical protein LBMAG48_30650 [Phycisphaerae bacterium]|jgi:hypothetical protein|nr:hypothetical protein LBMAG48_30650 [Phycisphaerae bacterium]